VQCFCFSDEDIEDTLYDNQAIRRIVTTDLSRKADSDETICFTSNRIVDIEKLALDAETLDQMHS